MIFYLFDKETRRPTGETLDLDVAGTQQDDIESAWIASGRELPVLCTQWAPGSQFDLFDGHGWTPHDLIDANTVILMLQRGVLDIPNAIATLDYQSLVDFFEETIRRALLPPVSEVYSIAEQQTWAQQKAEATALLNNASSVTPMIDAIAASEQRPREDVAVSVLDKSEKYEQAQIAFVAKANVIRQMLDNIHNDTGQESTIDKYLVLLTQIDPVGQ